MKVSRFRIANVLFCTIGCAQFCGPALAQSEKKTQLAEQLSLQQFDFSSSFDTSSSITLEPLSTSGVGFSDYGIVSNIYSLSAATPPSDLKGLPRAWSLKTSAAAGYDSNPFSVATDRESAYFTSVGLAAGFDLFRAINSNAEFDPCKPKYLTRAAAGYELGLRYYDGSADDANKIDQTFSFTFAHQITTKTLMTIELKDKWTHINENPFLNTMSAKPSFLYEIDKWISATAAYEYANLDYLFPFANPASEQNAHRHTGEIGAVVKPIAGSAFENHFDKITIAVGHSWNDAEGESNVYESNYVKLKIEKLRFWEDKTVLIDIAFSREWKDYDHETSGIIRDDDVDTFALQLYKMAGEDACKKPKVKLFVGLEAKNNGSNIATKDFDQYVLQAGAEYTF